MGGAASTQLNQQLEDKFSKVIVNKSQLATAQNALKRASANSFRYKLINERSRGIGKKDIIEYGEIVVTKLGLKTEEQKEDVRSFFRSVKMSEGHDAQLEELKLEVDEFTFIYGFMTAVVDANGNVDVAYAIYQLKFNLAEDPDRFFTIPEMEAIKTHYSKHQALLTLKQENVIKEISYSE